MNTIHARVQEGNIDDVRLLLHCGFNINLRDDHMRTPLHIAVQAGKLPIFHMLLQNARLNINAQDAHKNTPLLLAASRGSLEMVTQLILKGAVPDIRNDEGNYCFLSAVRGGFIDVVKVLIAYHVDPNLCDASGTTPLMEAVKQESAPMVALLLRMPSIDPHAKGSDGRTALDHALLRQQRDIRELLMNTSVSPPVEPQPGTARAPTAPAPPRRRRSLVDIFASRLTHRRGSMPTKM